MVERKVFFIISGAFFFCGAGVLRAVEQPPAPAQPIVNGALSRISPFLTVQEEQTLEKQGNVIPLLSLEVTAIFYAPQAEKSRAIIDGRVLSIGDTIQNKEIISISLEEIILQDSQARYVARLKKITPAGGL